ncbi:YheC/YheD family protein [Neobacillus mesonae]|nr:YheC/YheD family protein [Neobacillus mesonae]
MSIRRVSSKWKKNEVLLKDPQIAVYLPDTRKFNFNNLKKMCESHHTVYVKPEHGSHGKGIMHIERLAAVTAAADSSKEKDTYMLHYERNKRSYASLADLHQKIKKQMQGKSYLIQRGITLLRHKQRPFDLRIMTQKNLEGDWEATGIIGKVAAPDKIVTNITGGGKMETFEKLMKPYLGEAGTKKFRKELNSLAVKSAKRMEESYPGIKELGLDIALDQKIRPWILEVNTLPGIYVFRYLPDKSIYKKIKKYAQAYGRVKM